MKIRYITILLLLVLASALNAYSFGQNKINQVDENWSMIQTMHFDIYFAAGETAFGKLAALMAEETYYTLREDLTFPASSRIPIIFYPSKTSFQNTNIIYPLLTEGVGGFTESLRNRVVIPFDGSYSGLEELLAHELTHAYINALDRNDIGAFNALRPTSFPFWFSEGLPEFLSIGGEDDYNNMFVMDMVVNDKALQIENSSGYYAYRLGESFLTFISDTYGREKVSEYYFAIRALNNLESATKKIFGIDFDELESRWRYQLKRYYYPLVNSHDIPAEELDQRTDSKKDGSYFNFMPRFSPNGERYVYYSTAGARYSIWLAGLHGLSDPKKILTGESSGDLEEFYYFRSNLSWFPDNMRVAFAAKTSNGDRIHILDVEKEKIVQTLELEDFSAIYEVDVSPDGNSIVFAGQRGMKCDLYLYSLTNNELSKLTDDLYNDSQPRFAPDGMSIVFSSERSVDAASTRKGFFANVNSNIFSIDIEALQLQQLTFEQKDCSFPMYDSTATKLLFITSRDGISNVCAVNLTNPGKADVTHVLSGVFAADISPDNKHLLVSNYFDGAWNIYFSSALLDSLQFAEYPAPQNINSHDRLMENVDLAQLDYFGKRPKTRSKRQNPAAGYELRRPLLGDAPDFEFTKEDSLQLGRDFSYDDRPTKIGTIPKIEPYKTKFSLDSLWGGLAYSAGVGTVGYIELSLSDLMGNHGIGINAGISGKLEESNILLTYMYLKQRADYGVGVYNIFDEIIFRDPQVGLDDYYRFKQRQTGLYLLYRYPFSRFFRAEFSNMLYQRGQSWSDWSWNADNETGEWGNEYEKEEDIVYSPAITLVQDNSLYVSTGPLLGWRALYTVITTLTDTKLEYVTNYLDWRSYTLFSKRYSLAARAIAGISLGDSPQRFDLAGYYGVRAYDGDLTGEKKALVSAELRFPFFEYITLAFPIPLSIPNIRGSLFADLGTVFDEFESFRGYNNGKLQDLYLGYGFGPRLDMGYVILRFDITWLTNLKKSSKPTYYLSLSEDF